MRYFVAVAESLSFSRAARALPIAQPALSRQVKDLEAELGVELFDRAGRVVKLTSAGASLLPLAREVLGSVAALREHASTVANGTMGHLRVGVTPQILASFLVVALADFHQTHAGVSVEIVEAETTRLGAMVERGDLDLILGGMPELHGLERVSLYTFHLVAMVLASHPIAAAPTVDVRVLAGCPLLVMKPTFQTRQMLEAAFSLTGLQPTVRFESSNAMSLLSLAEIGEGIAVLGDLLRLPSTRLACVRVTVDGEPLNVSVSIAWNARRYRSASARAFVESIMSTASRLDERGPGGTDDVRGRAVGQAQVGQVRRESAKEVTT